eukprot:5557128-Amphidinium_carterae.1
MRTSHKGMQLNGEHPTQGGIHSSFTKDALQWKSLPLPQEKLKCGTGPFVVWLPAGKWPFDKRGGLHGSVVFPLTGVCVFPAGPFSSGLHVSVVLPLNDMFASQCFTWDEADYKVKWDSALQLCKEASDSKPDFQGLASGLATQALRQRKLDEQSQKDSIKSAFNASLSGVLHEACACQLQAVEDLEHIVHHCHAWAAERRDVDLPAPPCVKLHGLLPAPPRQVVLNHEPALAFRLGVHTVWTDGSGRHSSNPHFCRCGVSYYTDTGESVFLPLPALKQSVYRAEFHRAEFLAVVRALEECKPKRLVGDCKGVVYCLHALKAGRRHPKGRHRDVESRALAALPAGQPPGGFGRQQSTCEHVPLELSEEWKQWSTVCQAVRNFWLLVGPKLRIRPEQWPRVRLPVEPELAVVGSEGPVWFPAEPF